MTQQTRPDDRTEAVTDKVEEAVAYTAEKVAAEAFYDLFEIDLDRSARRSIQPLFDRWLRSLRARGYDVVKQYDPT